MAKRTKMFTLEDCVEGSYLDNFEGKYVVLAEMELKEQYRTPQDQVWYANGGFGLDPSKMGRAVFCQCIGDGEQTRWNRGQFIGFLKDEVIAELDEEQFPFLKKVQEVR